MSTRFQISKLSDEIQIAQIELQELNDKFKQSLLAAEVKILKDRAQKFSISDVDSDIIQFKTIKNMISIRQGLLDDENKTRQQIIAQKKNQIHLLLEQKKTLKKIN